MFAELFNHNGTEVTVQFPVKLPGSMLDDAQSLQRSLNNAGQIALQPMLAQFDTTGEPIRLTGIKHTVRVLSPQTTETPSVPVQLARNVYPNSRSVRVYVPLESAVRLVLPSPPRYSQLLSVKYARFCAAALCEALL